MSAVDHRKEFLENGYTIVRGFFNQGQMDKLIDDIKTSDVNRSGLDKGHLLFYSNIFQRSASLREFLSQPRLVDFLKGVIGPDFWVRWDQAVYKGPGAPEFPWHQDNGYNFLKDQHFQLWIALNKMTAERGGLWLIPGSHKRGLVAHKTVDNHVAYEGPTDDAVCVDAEVGDLVLFSSLMLHYTSKNTSQFDRWAYVAEYMSLDHFDPYIEPPYFIVARNGKPAPEFVNFYRGRLQPSNQLKYALPRLRRGIANLRTKASKALRSRG